MPTYAIDTYSAIEDLKAVGFKENQAKVVTSLFASRQSELATKNDLKTAITELKAELKGDIAELRTELKGDIAELKGDIAGLRTELKGDITELKGDIAELRTDNAVLQEQIRSTRIESRVSIAFMIAMLVPMFLQSFGLI